MTWTIERMKQAGFLESISEKGMARLEQFITDGTLENWVPANATISPDDPFNEEYRTQLTAQWEKTGLLENIEGERPRFLMSQLLENQNSYLKFINEEGNCTTLLEEDKTRLTHIALPIVVKAFATLIHFPSFGVIASPVALDKRHVSISSIHHKLKVILNPDYAWKVKPYSGLDAEEELCRLLGEYTKQEFSTIVLNNTLQGRDTYWYTPFCGAQQEYYPQTFIRRIGFMTRYATSSTEKLNDN